MDQFLRARPATAVYCASQSGVPEHLTSVTASDDQRIRIQNYTQLLNNLGGEGPALLNVTDPTVLIQRDIAVFWALLIFM